MNHHQCLILLHCLFIQHNCLIILLPSIYTSSNCLRPCLSLSLIYFLSLFLFLILFLILFPHPFPFLSFDILGYRFLSATAHTYCTEKQVGDHPCCRYVRTVLTLFLFLFLLLFYSSQSSIFVLFYFHFTGNQSWKLAARFVMDMYVQRTHGTYVEQKGNELIWQYRSEIGRAHV